MANLAVTLVSARAEVWSGSARMLVAPAADGEIGILAGHSPVLSVLRPGRLRIHPADGSAVLQFRIDAGFMSVDSDEVTVAVDTVTQDVADGGR